MKLPNHVFSEGPPCRWHITGGGDVVQAGRSEALVCKRCLAVSDPIQSVAELATFLHAHAGATCGAGVDKPARVRATRTP